MSRIIGFSTGALFQSVSLISEEIFQIISDAGCNHVEVHAHSEGDIDELFCNEEWLGACACEKFNSRSVHLPAVKIDKDNALYFSRAISLFLSSNANVIIHPNFEHDFDEIMAYFPRIAVENMDNRKGCFKSMEDVREILEQYPKLNFCLDVQHWVVNGNCVAEIPGIIEEFGDRLIEVHLSGVGEDLYHIPVHREKQRSLVESLRDLPKHIPLVLEGVCKNTDEMKCELEYVKDILN